MMEEPLVTGGGSWFERVALHGFKRPDSY